MSVLKPYRVKRTPLSKKLRIILPALGITLAASGAIFGVATNILKKAKDDYTETKEKVVVETEQEKITRQTAEVEEKALEAYTNASSNEEKGIVVETVYALENLVEEGSAEEETINKVFDVVTYVNDFANVVRELPAIIGNSRLSQPAMRVMMNNKTDLMDEYGSKNPKDFISRLDEDLYDFKYQTCFVDEMSYEERMTINSQCRDIKNVLNVAIDKEEYSEYSDICRNIACCYSDFSNWCFAREEVDASNRALELYSIYHSDTHGDCATDVAFYDTAKAVEYDEDGNVIEDDSKYYSDMEFAKQSPKYNFEYFLNDDAHCNYVLTDEGRDAIKTCYSAFEELITRFNKVLEIDGNIDNPCEGANLQLVASTLVESAEMLFTQYDDICYYLSENTWAYTYFSDSYVAPDTFLLGSTYCTACNVAVTALSE